MLKKKTRVVVDFVTPSPRAAHAISHSNSQAMYFPLAADKCDAVRLKNSFSYSTLQMPFHSKSPIIHHSLRLAFDNGCSMKWVVNVDHSSWALPKENHGNMTTGILRTWYVCTRSGSLVSLLAGLNATPFAVLAPSLSSVADVWYVFLRSGLGILSRMYNATLLPCAYARKSASKADLTY